MTNIDFNKAAQDIYQQNKSVGWWDDPDRCIYQTLQLVSTEIAEATEGERKNLMDDHLPSRKMGEVELADALIRILDVAGRYDWKFISTVLPAVKFDDPNLSIGGKHLFINEKLINLVHNLHDDLKYVDQQLNYSYTGVVLAIVQTAEHQGYDIISAMDEKLRYNQNRADHKRENRAKEGGKTF